MSEQIYGGSPTHPIDVDALEMDNDAVDERAPVPAAGPSKHVSMLDDGFCHRPEEDYRTPAAFNRRDGDYVPGTWAARTKAVGRFGKENGWVNTSNPYIEHPELQVHGAPIANPPAPSADPPAPSATPPATSRHLRTLGKARLERRSQICEAALAMFRQQPAGYTPTSGASLTPAAELNRPSENMPQEDDDEAGDDKQISGR